MRFIETPIFTVEIQVLLPDDEYRALQASLLIRPDAGPVIPASNGLRKLRWGRRDSGKRGGLRVIYYWYPADNAIYMLFVYSKARQKNLTREQLRTLRQLIQENLA